MEYLIKAGQKAFNHYANDLSINCYTHAIALAKELSISGDRLAEIYDLRGATYEGMRFYEETIDDYSEAAKLYESHTKRAYIFQQLAGFYALVVNDNNEAMNYNLMGIEEIDPIDKSREASKAYANAGAYLIYYHTDLQKGENLMQKAIGISEEMGYNDLLADQYAWITEIYNHYPSRLSKEVRRKWREAREKALWYLEHFKPDDLRVYASICLCLGNNAEGEEFEYFKREAIEAGTRCGDDWIVLHTAAYLGFYYHGKGDIQKAVEVYEKAWSAGIKVRYVFSSWMQDLIYQLMSLYASRCNWPRLLEMTSEALDSTKLLHSKIKVYPTVLDRWNNNMVDGLYKTLRMVAPETYRNFKGVLISRLNETNNAGEKFFYSSQLMLLELLDGQLNSAKDYMHKMKDHQPKAGIFAERVSKRLVWASRLLSAEPEQYKTIANELLISLDQFDDFQYAIDTISWILPKDEIDVTVDLHQLVDYVSKRYGTDIISPSPLVEIERIYMRYGHSAQLRSLEEKIRQSMPDKLKVIGNSQIFMEITEPAKLGDLEFVDNFECDPISYGWEWTNPEAYFSYRLLNDNGKTALEVDVPLRHGCWIDEHKEARLSRSIDGDFVLETHIRDGSKGKKFGGLFIWNDDSNYIRFEVHATPSERAVSYEANINGMGILPGVHPYDGEGAWLRLERKGDRFIGYISPDGEIWYLCGWLDFPMDGSIRVGIQALCPVLPITSTEFDYFKIYRLE